MKLTRVLVALKHHLGISSHWIPELNTTVLGTTHHPGTVGCQAHTENKVLYCSKLASAYLAQVISDLTLWPSNVRIHLPPLTALWGCMPRGTVSSQSLIVLSRLPLTRSRPLGANATE